MVFLSLTLMALQLQSFVSGGGSRVNDSWNVASLSSSGSHPIAGWTDQHQHDELPAHSRNHQVQCKHSRPGRQCTFWRPKADLFVLQESGRWIRTLGGS